MTTAWVFPGQGSQRKGMGEDVLDRYPELCAIADAVIGHPVRALCLEDDELLHHVRYAQPAMFVVNALSFLAARDDGDPLPDFVAGHSLGEYAALFAAGCFDFETGLRLVRRRGEVMDGVTGGGMLAVLGLDSERVGRTLAARGFDDVDLVNLNGPEQLVLSGPAARVRELRPVLREAGATKCVLLNVDVPAHSRYMEAAADEFATDLHAVRFASPALPVIANLTAAPYPADGIADMLRRHLYRPVRWLDSMNLLLDEGVAEIREIGPGQVLGKFWAAAKAARTDAGTGPATDCGSPAAAEAAPPPAATVPGADRLVLISAAGAEQLREVARRLRDHVREHRGLLTADVAYTTQTGRTAMAHRALIDAPTPDGLVDALTSFIDGHPGAGLRHAVVGPQTAARTEAVPAPRTFDEAQTAWLAGAEVDWAPYWDRPGTRVRLPAYPFATRLPDTAAPPPAADDPMEAYLIKLYAEVSGIPRAELHPRVPLESYGLSSLIVNRLNARIEADLGYTSRTLFFTHTDLAGVAAALTEHAGTPRDTARPLSAVGPQDGVDDTAYVVGPEDVDERAVAIVGLAGRYPQAAGLGEFWANLAAGRDCVGPIPEPRRRPGWPVDIMWGGFLDGVDTFDPLLFGITPRDAALMDPQERQFLQTTWEAFEDAGYSRERLRTRHGSRVAVYAGSMYNEYPFFGVERSAAGDPTDTGSAIGGIANRVSYFYDLHGPSMTVDTMCSSSLTAINLAIRDLRQGDCEMAVAGGVNLSLHPNKFIQQRRMKLTASGLRSRSFGEGGDGFVPSEGVGVVVLKPLRAALADGDRVRAVIRGSAVVHAGRTNGYIVPSPVAQGDLVRRALDDAGVDPTTIGYVEAHGAGTALGDPVEIDGLVRGFAEAGPEPGSVRIGAVKSNIGHVEAAAGIAGLTKVVLQLEHRTLVPSLHAERLNPNVAWDEVAFAVQRERADWPAPADGGPRRAGLSSFGAGGTIAHAVLEEAPAPVRRPHRPGPRLVVLSGYDEDRLREVAGRLADFVAAEGPELMDVAHTTQTGREHLRERLAVVALDTADLAAQLRRFLAGEPGDTLRGRAPAGARTTGPVLPDPGDTAPDPHHLAQHWAQGGTVDWAALYVADRAAGAAPRTVTLPTYPFARTRCWVAEPPGVPGYVAATGSASITAKDTTPQEPVRTVPLCTKVWEPAVTGGPATAAVPPVPTSGGIVVCLTDRRSGRTAEALAATLGGDIRIVHPDETGTLPAAERVTGWIDLCDLEAEAEAEADGDWHTRLALLQQLLAGRAGRPLRIVHLTRGLVDLPGGTPSLAGARTAAFVRALGAEYRPVIATTVDVGDAAPEDIARYVADEWRRPKGIGEVSYRKSVRYEPKLRPVTVSGIPLRPDPTRTYLVTGGTRGIGARVARHLVDRGATHIALLGTRRHAEADATVRELERAGARVSLHTGALTDRAALRAFLDRARAAGGPLGGVVHCAGTVGRGRPAFVHRTQDEISAVLEPKTDGLQTLEELCRDEPLDFFVTFSSICASVPRLASGMLDYAAANGFMDYYAGYRRRLGPTPLRSVGWTMWQDSGSGRGGPNVCASVGLAALDDESALHVLDQVLALPGGTVAVPCPPLHDTVDRDALLRVDTELKPAAEPAPASTPVPGPVPAAGVPRWLSGLFSATLGVPLDDLDPTTEFGDLGVESVMLGELLEGIEDRVGRQLEPAMLLDHPTLERLSRRLAELGITGPTATEQEPAPEQVTPPAPVSEPLPSPERVPAAEQRPVPQDSPVRSGGAGSPGPDERVAVIGMACRFPGAPDVGEFWENLTAGRDSITEVPRSRWDPDRYYRATPQPGRSLSRWGGFLDGVENFDAGYFGMSDAEGAALDPAIRLFLEAVATGLSDAGYEPHELRGDDIGVFVGGRTSDYATRAGLHQQILQSDQHFIAAHVAHHFDWHGPNLVVDSACSSSLVAVRLAMQSLLAGDCTTAVVGGVELLLDERPYLEFSAARAVSPTGRCHAFDESADGFVPGEGCGVVVLKPLSAALADGDRIHAVIESTAVNNDGQTMGRTTPNPAAQAAVVRRALARAGRTAGEIGLIEAHGTGTLIGDPLELRALTDVFRESTDATGFCAIGSVKSNLGHLLAAAGLAGLLKAVLSVEHGVLPPTLFCENPNPRFDFARSPFFPNTSARDWPAGRPPVAGVSSFGLGGTNVHLIVAALEPDRHGTSPAAVRAPLPPPPLRPKRLWLDRHPVADEAGPTPVSGSLTPTAPDTDAPLVPSLLQLDFI
ncbi:ACP S-malonyltransferase [Streptomyces yanii]|uniref:ACP S-malonyltransferase n=1 Tax=Streptomyces yanii TaxID=78510 RepID=A0ABV5R3M5_9ACTN